jgi:hypothetical protein
LSGFYPLDLSGLGDPIGSNATAGLALRVTGTHKPLYYGKVEIPIKGSPNVMSLNLKLSILPSMDFQTAVFWGFDTIYFCRLTLTFWRNIIPPSSGLKELYLN